MDNEFSTISEKNPKNTEEFRKVLLSYTLLLFNRERLLISGSGFRKRIKRSKSWYRTREFPISFRMYWKLSNQKSKDRKQNELDINFPSIQNMNPCILYLQKNQSKVTFILYNMDLCCTSGMVDK